MKKIIGFDSWTGGVSHFARLEPALKAKGFDLELIHLGSWGNDTKCPVEYQIENLIVRDIKYFNHNSLEKILETEKPVAVILLSTDTFAHRAFIRYCSQKNIPTLNLYHGLVELTHGDHKADVYSISYFSHVRYILSKLSKLFKYTFPCYFKALIKTKAKQKEWIRFFLDIFYMAKNDHFLRPAAPDAKTNCCAVYTQADAEHAIRFYGFSPEDIFIVGNPDLLKFNLNESFFCNWKRPTAEDKKIMYIETGFSSAGLFFSSEQDFVNHLIDTSSALTANGFKMLLKLKPHAFNAELIKIKLKSSGIELIDNNNFISELMHCSACIVETTTLAMVPAMLGMPLLLAQYGRLKSLGFGSVLKAYPRSYFLYDLSNILSILEKDLQIPNGVKLFEWIYLNAGPLPPEKMPERVAEVIEKMITNTKVV
jgi:hypothetical protein